MFSARIPPRLVKFGRNFMETDMMGWTVLLIAIGTLSLLAVYALN